MSLDDIDAISLQQGWLCKAYKRISVGHTRRTCGTYNLTDHIYFMYANRRDKVNTEWSDVRQPPTESLSPKDLQP